MNLQQTADLANKISEVQWVKWVHPRTKPANTKPEKDANVLKASILPIHCARCLNMNGCCFAEDKCPEAPLHENCHCKAERIDSITVTAECPIEKISIYIFNPTKPNGKDYIFKRRGFTIADSATIKYELEKQAYNAYISGNYELGDLDQYGQRINIIVTLTNKNGKLFKFKTGWLVYPDGKISNATPFRSEI